jgi:hypothetical protein
VTILRDGSSCQSSEWNTVGEDEDGDERKLTIRDYLTYDEMCLSSLMGISSPTFFINNGNRNNCGAPMDLNGENDRVNFERFGYYVGLVGPRFERKDRMESRFILVQPEYNLPANGYGLEAMADQPLSHARALLALLTNFYFTEGEEIGFDSNWCNSRNKDNDSEILGLKGFYFPLFDDVEKFVTENPTQSRYYLHQKNKYVKPLYMDIEV